MTSYNAANERMKRQYFGYLAEAQGHSEQTIDAAAKAIARFEAYTGARTSSRSISTRPRLSRSRRAAGPPQRLAAEQGDAVRHPDRPEAVLRLARRTARLQVPHLLFGGNF